MAHFYSMANEWPHLGKIRFEFRETIDPYPCPRQLLFKYLPGLNDFRQGNVIYVDDLIAMSNTVRYHMMSPRQFEKLFAGVLNAIQKIFRQGQNVWRTLQRNLEQAFQQDMALAATGIYSQPFETLKIFSFFADIAAIGDCRALGNKVLRPFWFRFGETIVQAAPELAAEWDKCLGLAAMNSSLRSKCRRLLKRALALSQSGLGFHMPMPMPMPMLDTPLIDELDDLDYTRPKYGHRKALMAPYKPPSMGLPKQSFALVPKPYHSHLSLLPQIHDDEYPEHFGNVDAQLGIADLDQRVSALEQHAHHQIPMLGLDW